MSISGSRATDEINLDEFERRLRAAGAQQSQTEDPLAELSRLVEFSHLGSANGETPARRPAEAAVVRTAPLTSIEPSTLRPTLDDEVEELAPGASEADREARRDYEFDPHHSDAASAAGEERRPTRWKLAVSALALAGIAMIGGVFALRHGGAGFSKDAPFIAAAQGPTKVAPPSDQTVTTSSDAGATLLHRHREVDPGQSRQFRGAARRLERTSRGQQSCACACACGSRWHDGPGAHGDHQYPACRSAARSAAEGYDVGIPRPETRAYDLAQARWDADWRDQPA